MLDIIGKRFLFFWISAIVILAGVVSLVVFGLKPGVEFTSGSELTLSFGENATASKSEVTQSLAALGYSGKNVIIRQAGSDYIVDLPQIDDAAKAALLSGLAADLGQLRNSGFESVTRESAVQMTRNATIAMIIAALGMLLYISIAFRRMPNPIRWGTCAIIALVHDLVVVLGVFSLLSGLLGWQVDLMFVAGALTVIGYSVNDSIVIFDRIRENVRRSPGADFESLVNRSLVETISRTLVTGIGTIFVLVAMLLIIGDPIQNLVVVLLAGVITGTYSGMCTAAPLLVVWNKGEWGRFIGRRPASR